MGEADLSVNVNFGSIAAQFPPHAFDLHGPTEQGAFLKTFGIMERLKVLSGSTLSPSVRANLESGVERLTEPSEMGAAYKVLAAVSKS